MSSPHDPSVAVALSRLLREGLVNQPMPPRTLVALSRLWAMPGLRVRSSSPGGSGLSSPRRYAAAAYRLYRRDGYHLGPRIRQPGSGALTSEYPDGLGACGHPGRPRQCGRLTLGCSLMCRQERASDHMERRAQRQLGQPPRNAELTNRPIPARRA
jgi:hypothetical protein